MKTKNDKKRKYDYSQLKARTVQLGKTDRMVAEAANISPSTYSIKLNGGSQFTQDEMCSICNFLGIRYGEIPSYFFAVLV